MELIPIKTRRLQPPHDPLLDALRDARLTLCERDVLAISSKVVSIDEGRCVPITDTLDKAELVRREADRILDAEGQRVPITLKGHTLVGSAGIDASNADGHYILWPEDPFVSAKGLWMRLKEVYRISQLGIVLVDSHSVPLRLGAMGISIGFWGIAPIKDNKGAPDLFGRPFSYGRANLVDAIAAAAGLVMGEAAEQTPACIVRDIPGVAFVDDDRRHDVLVAPEEDTFYPLLRALYEEGEGKEGDV